jgi:hypothetical protein
MASPNRSISAEEAEKIAREHLDHLGLARQAANRTVTCRSKRGAFEIIFSPPPGVRAGDFTITVGQDGSIKDQRFER